MRWDAKVTFEFFDSQLSAGDVSRVIEARLEGGGGYLSNVTYVAQKGEPHTPGAIGRPPVDIQAAMEWLDGYLTKAEAFAGEVLDAADRAGHSRKTVQRAASELGVVKTPPGGGPTVTWQLPMTRPAKRRKERKS
jgi:hypothetical protein